MTGSDDSRPSSVPVPAGLGSGTGAAAAPGRELPPHLDPRGRALPPHLDPRGRGASEGVGRVAPGSVPLLPVVTPPAVPGRRRRVARVLSWVALALSVLVFGTAVLGYALYRKYDGNIARIPGLSQGLPGLLKPAVAPHGAKNVLLVGSDTRDTTGSQFQGKGKDRTTGQRSDTVILAHLYGGSDQAQLVSFPRDSYVTIPAFTDASGKVFAQHSAKLNSAIEEGGPALLQATIERLTDIRVDNYVQIDFAGFQSMVETLGGVEICLKHAAKESNSGIDLKAGRQIVKGAQALAFVRQRYELPNGDIDRIKRQQAFIGSITRKVLSSGTLLDPLKLNNFVNAATRSVQVDDGLSTSGLTQLALRLRGISSGGVSFTTLPYTDIGAKRDNQSVVLLDTAKTGVLFAALRADQSPDAPAPAPTVSPTVPLTVVPRSVRVSVLNGAGVAGLGRTAAQDLTRAGFVVVGSPGNRGAGTAGTVVRYGPTRSEAARTLAASVPGATLEADPALTGTLELVVGSAYAGAVPVTVTAPTTAAAPSASPPPVAPTTAAQDGCVD